MIVTQAALRRQFAEARRHAFGDLAKAEIARVALQMIINGQTEVQVRALEGKKTHAPKVDLVEQRRAEIEANLRKRGFAVSVPRPSVSNTTLKRWRREGRELFYRPSTGEVTYEAWMTSHGQGNHWTVANEAERAKIGWEPCAVGYWFTAEIAPACPRLKTSWNDLTATPSFKLLSLEEYAVVYWTHRDLTLTGVRLDVSTWCWLRTRFGLCALNAHDYGGEVRVYGYGASDLSVPYDVAGGRAVEVV